MNIADLQSFLAVVELHSISLAAKKMHITQPAMTNRIKKMEAEWNTQLFVSSGLRTELTQKGKELLPYVRQMMYLNDEMIKSTVDESKSPKLLINIGVSIYIAKTIFPQLTVNLNSLELSYFINTKLVAEKHLLSGLNSGRYDIIISPPTLDNTADLWCTPLWKEKILFVVGKDHPLASIDKELTLSELITFDAVLMSKSFYLRRIINKEAEHQKVPLKTISETNVIYNNIALAEEGLAWTMIYERLLNPKLVAIELSDYSPTVEFDCYTLKKRMDDRSTRIFVEHLRNWITTSSELSSFAIK